MFLFVKKRRNCRKRSFQLIHIANHEKRGKSKDFFKVIHIIHTKTYVFGELLTSGKRTNVLVSCNENVKLSKNPGLIIDFRVFKKPIIFPAQFRKFRKKHRLRNHKTKNIC